MSSSQFGGIIFRQYNIPTAEKWNKIINLLEDKEPDYEYKWENIFESWDDIREKLSNKSGIYMIACRKTGKYYVGSSRWTKNKHNRGLYTRISKHLLRTDLFVDKYYSHPFYAALRHYGKSEFTLYILDFVESHNFYEVRDIETTYLQKWRPAYNILMDGYGGSTSYSEHSPEIRQLLRNQALNRSFVEIANASKALIESSSIPVDLILIEDYSIKSYPKIKDILEDYPEAKSDLRKVTLVEEEAEDWINNILVSIKAFIIKSDHKSRPTHHDLKQLYIDRVEADIARAELEADKRADSGKVASVRRETHAVQLEWEDTGELELFRYLKNLDSAYPEVGYKKLSNAANEGGRVVIGGCIAYLSFVLIDDLPLDERDKLVQATNKGEKSPTGPPVWVAFIEGQVWQQYRNAKEASSMCRMDEKKILDAIKSPDPVNKIWIRNGRYIDRCELDQLPSWDQLNDFLKQRKQLSKKLIAKDSEARENMANAALDSNDHKDTCVLDLDFDDDTLLTFINIEEASQKLGVSQDVIRRRLSQGTYFNYNKSKGLFKWRVVRILQATEVLGGNIRTFSLVREAALHYNIPNAYIRKAILMGSSVKCQVGDVLYKVKFAWKDI